LAFLKPLRFAISRPQALSAEKRSMRVSNTLAALIQVGTDDRVAALRGAALAIDLARGIAARGEAEIGPDVGRLGEADGIVNRCPDRECDDHTHPRHGHEPATDRKRLGPPGELAVEVGDPVAQRLSQREQHPDQLGELRLVREFVAGDLREIAQGIC
jgi:hypothetical protein